MYVRNNMKALMESFGLKGASIRDKPLTSRRQLRNRKVKMDRLIVGRKRIVSARRAIKGQRCMCEWYKNERKY